MNLASRPVGILLVRILLLSSLFVNFGVTVYAQAALFDKASIERGILGNLVEADDDSSTEVNVATMSCGSCAPVSAMLPIDRADISGPLVRKSKLLFMPPLLKSGLDESGLDRPPKNAASLA